MARIARELTITPIHPYFGAREGVDLEETLDEPTFRRIFDAFQEHPPLATRLPIWDGIVPKS